MRPSGASDWQFWRKRLRFSFLRYSFSNISQEVISYLVHLYLVCVLLYSLLFLPNGHGFHRPSQLWWEHSLHVWSLETKCTYICFFGRLGQGFGEWIISGLFLLCYPTTGQDLMPRILACFSEPWLQWSTKVNLFICNLF